MGRTPSRTAASGLRGAPISLEVVDGPQDGLRLAEQVESLTIGRGIENTVELWGDLLASNEHVAIVWSAEQAAWQVQDVGSRNGTWLDGRRLEAPAALAVGTYLVIGQTVVSCRAPGELATFLPSEEQVGDEMARLTRLLDPRAARGLTAAYALAVAEKRPFLTERHLVLGQAMTNRDLEIFADDAAAIPRPFLLATLRDDDLWLGATAWIEAHLSVPPPVEVAFVEDVAATPRVVRCLLEAEALVVGEGRTLIHPLDLLAVVFADPTSRTRALFARDGYSAPAVVAAVARQVRDTPAPAPAAVTPAAGTSVAVDRPARSGASATVPKIDARVHDIAAAVNRLASIYRLSEPRERRTAMRDLLASEAAKVPVERRAALLEEVRHLFPVETVAPMPVDDAELLRRQLAELRAKVGSGPAVVEAPRRRVPWARILSGQGRELADEVDEEDAAAVAFVADVLGFSVAIERFVVAMALGLTQGTSSTARAQLPGHHLTIGKAASQVASRGALDADELDRYLGAIEAWLVATVAGYHDGPETWFTAFWGKVSPGRIEAKIPKSFGSDGKCWGRYKELVRTITPDLVVDEIQVLVREKAEEQVKKLTARRVRR